MEAVEPNEVREKGEEDVLFLSKDIIHTIGWDPMETIEWGLEWIESKSVGPIQSFFLYRFGCGFCNNWEGVCPKWLIWSS